ncbi:O-methyltransferase [Gammaproteobacteria bacterium]
MSKFIGNVFWGIKDLEKFYRSLGGIFGSLHYGTEGGFASDQLITIGRNLTFTWDEDFVRSYEAHAKDDVEQALIWRRAVHYWAGRHCIKLDGDFVECGVWKGTSVHLMYDALNFGVSGKAYWLYDAFDFKEGDLHHALDGLEAGRYEKVKERFAFASNVNIIQGYVPESFKKGLPDRVSLLHIDINNAPAEIAALDALWSRVVPGGIVLLDDFGWSGYSAQTVAELEYFKVRDYHILELPTGQGLVIKR